MSNWLKNHKLAVIICLVAILPFPATVSHVWQWFADSQQYRNQRLAEHEVWSQGVVLRQFEPYGDGYYRAKLENTNSVAIKIMAARHSHYGEQTSWFEVLPGQTAWEVTFDQRDRFYVYNATGDLLGFINPMAGI